MLKRLLAVAVGVLLVAVLFAACLWLAGTLNAQDPKINAAGLPQSSVQGVVSAIDPEGQSTPLEGISLTLSGGYLEAQSLSTLTDDEGHYEFTQLGAGTYWLQASLEGFQPLAKSVVLKQNETRVDACAALRLIYPFTHPIIRKRFDVEIAGFDIRPCDYDLIVVQRMLNSELSFEDAVKSASHDVELAGGKVVRIVPTPE